MNDILKVLGDFCGVAAMVLFFLAVRRANQYRMESASDLWLLGCVALIMMVVAFAVRMVMQ